MPRRAALVALVLGLSGARDARAQAEALAVGGFVLDVGLTGYDVGMALFERLPSRTYAVVEMSLAVPQLAAGGLLMANDKADLGGAFVTWGSALTLHAIWRLAFAPEPGTGPPALVPTVTSHGVGLAGVF